MPTRTNQNNATGEGLKSRIKQNSFFELIRELHPLPKNASYEERRDRADLLIQAIDQYRAQKNYEDTAGIDHQLPFLFNETNYHDEARKMRETTVALLGLLAHPDVIRRLDGYFQNYAGGMLLRLYWFLTNTQTDWLFTYLDKSPIVSDEGVEDLNKILERYRHADQKEVMYHYTDLGMTY